MAVMISPPVRTGAPAQYRDTIERVLASYCNEYPNHILDPELDQHRLVDLHEWHCITEEEEYL